MTRKEAIKRIQEHMIIHAGKEPRAIYITDALQMAIRALDQEPFINKPCISAGVCEHDKQNVLDKMRTEIELEKLGYPPSAGYYKAIMKCLQIIDKYKAESEVRNDRLQSLTNRLSNLYSHQRNSEKKAP